MTDPKPVPLYTRAGFRVTVLMALLLAALLLKNCAGAIHYGATTDQEAIRQYYDAGYAEGMRQARQQATPGQEEREGRGTENPLLEKARVRGFRDGWDAARRGTVRSGNPLLRPPDSH